MSRDSIVKYAKSPEIVQRFSEIVGDARAANIYVNSVIVAVASNERLQQCTPQSVMKSAADAAILGLSVDPNLKEAYLVPYKDQCTMQVGWRGVRNMAYNSGKVHNMNVGRIYEGQEWIEDQLTGQARIEGIATSKKPVGYFAYLETRDHRIHTLFMSVEDINDHKQKYSPGWNRQDSAWNKDFDKMAKKTVLKQMLYQWAELSPIAVELDDIENTSIGEDFPDPGEVTIIEPEKIGSRQILKELGYDDDEGVFDDYDNSDDDIEDAEYQDVTEPEPEPAPAPVVKPKPAPQQKKETPTNYPGSSSEFYSMVVAGGFPHVGVKDAKKALEAAKGELDIAYETVKNLSTEREAMNKNPKQAAQKDLF